MGDQRARGKETPARPSSARAGSLSRIRFPGMTPGSGSSTSSLHPCSQQVVTGSVVVRLCRCSSLSFLFPVWPLSFHANSLHYIPCFKHFEGFLFPQLNEP